MNRIERSMKIPFFFTGFFTTLCDPFRGRGGGASFFNGTGAPSTPRRLLSVSLFVVLGALAVTAPAALAAGPEAPETTGSKSVTATTAVIEGVLNPHSTAKAGWYIAYSNPGGLSCLEGPATGVEKEEVVKAKNESFEVTGLEPNMRYMFCMVATNEAGEVTPSVEEVVLTTTAAPPAIIEEKVSNVKASEVTLEGIVNPNNQLTECHFQYGTTSVSENTVPCTPASLEAVFDELNVSPVKVENGNAVPAPITGLEPGKLYKYRIVAKNGKGEESTKEATFKTAISLEAPVEVAPEPVGSRSATLKGILNLSSERGEEPGSYEFLYRRSSTECRYVPVPGLEKHLEEEIYHLEGLHEGQAEEKRAELQKYRVEIKENKTSSSTPAAGQREEKVSASVTELLPGTTYTYCLRTTNAGEEALGAPEHFTTLAAAPTIEEASATNVAATSATLNAKLNPDGADTTYRFEYGTNTSYGTSVEGDAGSRTGEAHVEAHVQGLEMSTTYHYRIVASSEVDQKVEMVVGPDETFTTESSGKEFSLLDNRQWEQVTPADKHGALFYGLNIAWVDVGGGKWPFVAQAAANGDAIVNLASQPTEGKPAGYSTEPVVLSARGPSGWSSQVLSPPHEEPTGPAVAQGSEYRYFSQDLSHGLLQPFGGFDSLISPEASEVTPYLRADFSNGNAVEPCKASCYLPLVTRANTLEGVEFGEEENDGRCEIGGACGPKVIDVTPDLSHVILQAGKKCECSPQLTSTPNEPYSGTTFYEWGAGQLQPLYLLPKGEGGFGVASGGPMLPLGLLNDGGSLLPDGSVVFTHNEHLYLHDFAKDESVRLDVAQGVTEPSEGGASLLYTSGDGSDVFFTDSQQLTTAPGGGMYECRLIEVEGNVACELELTGLSSGRLIGGSEEASYLYFESAAGKLVVDHRGGGGWSTTEVPTIPINALPGSEGGVDTNFPYRVSPSGRFLAFMSSEELTGYDNVDVNEEASTFRDAGHNESVGQKVHHDMEVYLYDAATNKLICASCNPTGARPVGTKPHQEQLVEGYGLLGQLWTSAILPPWIRSSPDLPPTYQTRYLSNTGRLFFNSIEALAPQDVNGTWDVYEYEPNGVGGCSTGSATFGERSEGCVGLVSSGASPQESAFVDASETGGDVFFLTTAKLVPADYDTAYDVYDARECTETSQCFPLEQASPPACNTEASCKAVPTPQPEIYGAPPSATFNGVGNFISQSGQGSNLPVKNTTKKVVKCKKGFARNKQGKCVGKKSKKSRKAIKSSHSRRASR